MRYSDNQETVWNLIGFIIFYREGMHMNSREIITRVIEFDCPCRIGLDFNEPNQNDIAWILSARLRNKEYEKFSEWGCYEEELQKLAGFKGEINKDPFGNVYGRLGGKTKGECVKGALQDSWDLLKNYKMPGYDESYERELAEILKQNEGRFLLAALPVAVFSTIRDLRGIENVLMDLILEKEMVVKCLENIESLSVDLIKKASALEFDGIIMYDDWGTQSSLMINPDLWREIFKPIYKRIVKATHDEEMKFFLHSCGYVYEIIEDFIEIGIDVLQFDQPELVGVEKLSKEFGGRVTFWSPVDIQKVMRSGNKLEIQQEANKMLQYFGKFKGGFIAEDYPSWEDIDVKEEWAQWARGVFMKNADYN